MFKPGDYVILVENYLRFRNIIKPIIVLGVNQTGSFILVRFSVGVPSLREKLPGWVLGYRDTYIPNIKDYLDDCVDWYEIGYFSKAKPITVNLPDNIIRQAHIEPVLDSIFNIEDFGKVIITEMSEDKQMVWAEIVE